MPSPVWIKEGGTTEAYQVLKRRAYDVGTIYSYDKDSILYVTSKRQPRTAWIKFDQTGLVTAIHVVLGFQVDPPKSWEH